ncbi:hypothetical protein F3Y22_tig00110263pilonHSYRG00095 [Hibiscus syriacus]|uniref:Transmembrane protein n=1 Tax=Hibiscus syriacus TaxID=106335 RepID=A0A6A3B9K6_HIBSY|nr:hypothetical protein F3Y22_tig00110263pilonHSYRG00095 [Hibiscus syriacus]
MGSFWQKFLFFFLLTIHSFVSETISLEDNNPTTYEILRDFNFSTVLLPAGVTAYDFDPLSGKTSTYLNGRIATLEGVSVKFIFFWVNVVEVLRKDDELEFSVGVAADDSPMDDFDDNPQCECRFLKCSHQEVKKIGQMTYVSSLLGVV